jgi:ABC-type multidrug transport system fused ATPase/permease subunit
MRVKSRLREILPFLRPYRVRLTGLLVLTLALSVLAMLPPLVTRAIIDHVVIGRDHSLLPVLGALMVGLPILNAFCGYIQTLGIAYIGQHFVFDLRDRLYTHLLGLSMRFFGGHSVGMLVNRLMGDSGTVQNVLTAQTIGIVSDLVCSAFAITAVFAINWRMALVIAVIVAIFVGNFRVNIATIRRANRGYRSSMDRLSAGVSNRLNTTLAIKTHGTEWREHDVFLGQSEESLDIVRGMDYANIRFMSNTSLLSEGGRAVIYFLGCAMVLADSGTYGDVVAFTAYAMQLLGPAVRFSLLARQVQDGGVAADRLFEILDERPDVSDTTTVRIRKRLSGTVDFEHVGFHYDVGKPVIHDFNLHVDAGQNVALIGPTGCGKSTILSLLLRFYDVTHGKIEMDGVDIRTMPLDLLRRQFGIVLQEPLLFTASVAENIRYGRPNASQAEIEAAARVAEIHDFIVTLPEGYRTQIGGEATQLSVGQKQRITIARAVAANPAILIMDEATSALDSESERAIQTAMERVLKGRTAFIVAHRLSTIRRADIILLLKDGRVVERGSHDALMQRDGAYAKLYRSHMGTGSIAE